MNKIDMNLLPKEFCDQASSAFNQYMVFFAFSSGQKVTAFGTSPIQFKLIAKMFNENVALYEKQFGKIDLERLKLVSPLQLKDLNSGKDDTHNKK